VVDSIKKCKKLINEYCHGKNVNPQSPIQEAPHMPPALDNPYLASVPSNQKSVKNLKDRKSGIISS
jgi:hypothetical protein